MKIKTKIKLFSLAGLATVAGAATLIACSNGEYTLTQADPAVPVNPADTTGTPNGSNVSSDQTGSNTKGSGTSSTSGSSSSQSGTTSGSTSDKTGDNSQNPKTGETGDTSGDDKTKTEDPNKGSENKTSDPNNNVKENPGLNKVISEPGTVSPLKTLTTEKLKGETYGYAPRYEEYQLSTSNEKLKKLVFQESKYGIKYVVFPVNGKYYFDEKTILEFNDYLLKHLNYTSEILYISELIFNTPFTKMEEAKGYYTTPDNRIYFETNDELSSDTKSLTTIQRIENIFGTLQHEYIHHVDNVYLRSIKDEKSDQVYKIYQNQRNYEKDLVTAKRTDYQLYNKDFVNAFIKSLNYEFNALNNSYKNENYNNPEFNFIGKYFSASELFLIANGNPESPEVEALVKKYGNNKYVFKTEKSNLNSVKGSNRNSNQEFTLTDIRYYYSLSELIAREFTKIGTASIFTHEVGDQTLNIWGRQSLQKENLYYPSVFMSDWSRAVKLYSNINRRLIRNGSQTVTNVSEGYEFLSELSSSLLMANSVYGGSLQTTKGEAILKNKVNDLYNAYLNALGINNEISLMYIKNNATGSAGSTKDRFQSDTVRFSGFLNLEKAKTYKGLVIQNGNKYEITDIKLINYKDDYSASDFPFKVKSSFTSDNDLNPNQTLKSETLVSWYSDAFVNLANKNNPSLYFWNDLNNDELLQENELVNVVNKSNKLITSQTPYLTAGRWYNLETQNGVVKIATKYS
ncbi:MYPU_1760 family metalloprotease [Mycoplasmopsis agassizii]|uniref:Lipoprotein n=1 Tax=Mycoplasmopsis agassizii TaxID=33922 RepID=A0ABX4H4Y1_9BACT|nr:hypothetical protein [Mycoplasmopsis agassizii]PAF54946.1 hypothetical protein CJF60_04385 [Mycoplasmopsis agassizii]SMC17023.1 hypothetical protein SAMN02745179_00375 [Mycoplasmopsis agassizii]